MDDKLNAKMPGHESAGYNYYDSLRGRMHMKNELAKRLQPNSIAPAPVTQVDVRSRRSTEHIQSADDNIQRA